MHNCMLKKFFLSVILDDFILQIKKKLTEKKINKRFR